MFAQAEDLTFCRPDSLSESEVDSVNNSVSKATAKLWRPPAIRNSARHLFLAYGNQHSILYNLERCQIVS